MSPSSDEAPRVSDDVESRLADATAELIFLRANEKRLLEENTHLKARCERLSVELLEGRTYADAERLRSSVQGAHRRGSSAGVSASRTRGGGSSHASTPRGERTDVADRAFSSSLASPTDRNRMDAAFDAHEDRVLHLFLTDGKNLTERKVPGIVSAPRGALEFGTVQARLQATEFVGFRPLKRGTDVPVEKPLAKSGKSKMSMSKQFLGMLSKAASASSGDLERAVSTPSPPPFDAAGEAGNTGGAGCDAAMSRSTGDVSSAAGNTNGDGSDHMAAFDLVKDEGGMGMFEIMWKDGGGTGPLRRLAFEANEAGFAYIREQVGAWSDAAAHGVHRYSGTPQARGPGSSHRRSASAGDAVLESLRRLDLVGEGNGQSTNREDDGSGMGKGGEDNGSDTERGEGGDGGEQKEGRGKSVRDPRVSATTVALSPGPHTPTLSEDSAILSMDHVRSIVTALPARCRLCNWRLAYSSRRDGISLRSLYRAANGKGCSAESVIVVRDVNGASFGAFATERWKVSPRYYGTGESFVFTAEPFCVAYKWSAKNDYFMFGRGNCLAVGGGSGFALWLDEELLRGNSGESDTFDNPCLASDTEFEIAYLELWTFEPSR